MKMINLSLIFGVFAIAISGSPAVMADAGKTIYPGSMCVPWTANDPVPRLNSSRIFNDSTRRWMRVDCPILHQDFRKGFLNLQKDSLDDADIGVIDAHSTSNARCWLASRHQNLSRLYSWSGGTRNTVGFGSHEQNLDFKGVPANDNTWYYIGCLIPPKQHGRASGITYYSSDE
ncbi:MAG: hypothetical protein AXA67_12210 [Methylothermaceae bacteria B42]|nr:MAG: hypothetical protein AXA67_12210 [Methylothermaceae bacteria B42]HHJ39294.1 hypothetical protein [Methylothermaceae bacterium]